MLRYYLARNDTNLDRLHLESAGEELLGGYRVVVAGEWVRGFQADTVLEYVNDSARVLGVPPGDPMWVVSVAWWQPSLASRLSVVGDPDVREFGRISVIKTPHTAIGFQPFIPQVEVVQAVPAAMFVQKCEPEVIQDGISSPAFGLKNDEDPSQGAPFRK
jgi:hypothetical protein